MEIITSQFFDGPPQPWTKAYRYPRPTSDVTAWEAHQTAVAGGFGVSRQALERHDGDRWAALMERFEGSAYLSDKELRDGKDGRVGQPYHYLYRPQEDRLIRLHHPSRVTWHGDGGNRYSIGFAVDGKWPGDVMPEGLAEAFAAAVQDADDLGFAAQHIEAHRQHSSARGGDPGEQLWPVFELAGRSLQLAPRPSHTTGSGQPIPDSWRPVEPPSMAVVNVPEFTPERGRWSPSLEIVQLRLAQRGYKPGKVDGLWGPNTAAALSEFKAAEGLAGPDVDQAAWSALFAGLST